MLGEQLWNCQTRALTAHYVPTCSSAFLSLCPPLLCCAYLSQLITSHPSALSAWLVLSTFPDSLKPTHHLWGPFCYISMVSEPKMYSHSTALWKFMAEWQWWTINGYINTVKQRQLLGVMKTLRKRSRWEKWSVHILKDNAWTIDWLDVKVIVGPTSHLLYISLRDTCPHWLSPSPIPHPLPWPPSAQCSWLKVWATHLCTISTSL